MADLLEVRVQAIVFEADGVLSYEMRRTDGGELPPFAAGAHVDIHLPDGLVRSYSLVNPQDERHRYVIAVQKDGESRGGSRAVHDRVRAGDLLRISAPRNNFPLAEDAPHSLLIAGGIGITPLWCMVQRLEALGRPWTLHYAVRRREMAAFLAPIRALAARRPGRVDITFDGEPGGIMLDIVALVAAAPADAHLYCCGPLPMLAAFEAATAGLPPERVHVEYFTAKDEPATAGGFTVRLARTGRSVVVPAGSTILDALFAAGLDLPHSCLEGVCGTCETKVLEGVPDHRDLVLTPAERASNRTMMICCSGSKSETLVLDL